MEILNRTPYPFAPLPGRLRYPAHSLTLVAKGSFALQPGGVATPLEEQDPLCGDSFPEDDRERECLYENDFAPFKPRVDLLLCGSCHAPGGQPTEVCEASFQVGSWKKTLAVAGDRTRRKALLRSFISAPEPFTSMPLRYERAYGGSGWKRNPVGRGASGAALANIEYRECLDRRRNDPHPPAGFGPVHRTWAPRHALLGSYGGSWLRKRWPHFPEDFDWRYFNAAPEDQQLEHWLAGDEELAFGNLHPDYPLLSSRLPGVRLRCFLREGGPAGGEPREVAMHLDTLYARPEQQHLVLLWRGNTDVSAPELESVEQLLLVAESCAEEPAPPERYLAELAPAPAAPAATAQGAAAPPPGAPPVAVLSRPQGQRHIEELAREAGIDAGAVLAPAAPGELPRLADLATALGAAIDKLEAEGKSPPGDLRARLLAFEKDPDLEALERCARAEKARTPKALGRALLARLEAGEDLAEEDWSGADLAGADLAGAKLGGLNLARADLSGADLRGADLAQADLQGAVLRGADLHAAKLSSADLSQADLSAAELEEADAQDAILHAARLDEIKARGCDLSRADLSAAHLERADLRGAKLVEAAMERAAGAGVDLRKADLTGLRAGENTALPSGLFVGAKAPKSIWNGAELSSADFSRAALAGAQFVGARLELAQFFDCDLKQASFRKAQMHGVHMVASNLFQACFERADLNHAIAINCNFFQAAFFEAETSGADFSRSNLKGTLFQTLGKR